MAVTLACLLAAAGPSHAQHSYSRSWVGNSFGTGGSAGGKWVQNNLVAMWVAPDGRCFTASSWDEGKHECAIYKDGAIVGNLPNLHPDEGGGGGMSVSAITGDASWIYVGVKENVRRYKMDGGDAPFEGGAGKWKSEVRAAEGAGYVWALSADAANGRLFATFRGQEIKAKDKTPATPAPPDEVVVFDTKEMKLLARWALPRAGRSAVAPDGTLWIAQEADAAGGVAAKVLHFAPDGKKLPQEISGAAGFAPTALSFDGAGRLLVADNGPDQQIKIYAVIGAPKATDSFGAKGGIFSGVPGEVKPLKFCGLTGVGTDAAGNVFVAQNRFGPEVNGSQGAGSNLESYRPDGTRNWQLLGLEFVDGGDFVPGTDGAQIYSKYTRYTLDLAKSAPGSEWSYAAHTLNQFKYPNDPRFLHRNDHFDFSTTAFVRVLAGRRFVFNTSMWARRLEVYRFDAKSNGEIAIPCGFVSAGGGGLPNAPKDGEFIWRDVNGDGNPEAAEFFQKPDKSNAGGHGETVQGWWVDEKGGLWQAVHWKPNAVRHFPFGGLDAAGCPIWSYETMETFAAPEPFTPDGAGLMRVEYFGATDTLFLAGYTKQSPSHAGFNVKYIGTAVACYEGWSKGNRTAKWVNHLWDGEGRANKGPTSMRAAGDFLFIGYDGMPYQPDSGFVRAFRARDGGYAGRLWAGPNASGRMDVTYGVNAMKRANGEYLVLAEEDWYVRQMLYRWTPASVKPSALIVIAKAGNTTASLQWDAVPGAGYFAVQRAEKNDGPFTTLMPDAETTTFTDTKLANGTAVFYRVLAGGAAGDAVSEPIRVAPSAAAPLRINAGGGPEGDWLGDLYHDGKNAFSTKAVVETSAAGDAPPAVYQSGRVGTFTYTIPGQTPGRGHLVRLHFSEHEGGLVAWRKFDVAINGATVLSEFNVGSAAGNKGNVAVVKEFPGIQPDAKGEITIRFTGTPRFGALVNGIEIVPEVK